jgi:hypothetical protein
MTLQIVASLTDNSRGIIYDPRGIMFLVQVSLTMIVMSGSTKGGSITVPLTSRLTGLELAV